MRVAIIHDWLVTYAGAERVLEQIVACYPHADLFSLVDFLSDDNRGFIAGKRAITTFIQNFPRAKSRYRSYLPFMPLAIEQIDLSGYDLIISSSHAVAKGVLIGPDQLHICMCYSPIRYAWDMQFQYLHDSNLDNGIKGWLAKYILHKVRLWDVRTTNSVDHFIAISHFIGRRIQKAYRREATIIYPPVDIYSFSYHPDKSDYYLTASRMVPYKKMPIIVEAFSNMPDKQLIVIGDGPEFEKCRSIAGPNVILMGWQSFEVLKEYMQRAKAFIFAAEEDFGIAPLEAQACGTPVIAFGKGAARETIRGLDSASPTGVFFDEQSPGAIIEAVKIFEKEEARISPNDCRENVLRFAPEKFRLAFTNFVQREWEHFSGEREAGLLQ